MNYDNIKSHKEKQGLTLSLEHTFFEKPQGGGQIDLHLPLPSLFRVKIPQYNKVFVFATRYT